MDFDQVTVNGVNSNYNRHNRRKYSLKVHIVLVTKYRKQLLQGSIADDVKQKILDIANTRGYEIIAMETDKDHIHFLLSYDATDRVCDIVKIVKQETTYYLWQKYNSVLSKQYWKKKIFWSDGYFACSIGEVSSATIQKYIESQG
jgi:putative transposase